MNELLNVKTLSPLEIAKLHNVPVEQIRMQVGKGIEVELEHTNDWEIAMEIALDHLSEMPDYYDRIKKMEKQSAPESMNTNMLPFVTEELLEARLLKDTQGLINKSSQDIADLIFITFLALNIIKYYNMNFASNYARGTTMYYGYDGIRSAGTDLHNYISVVTNHNRYKDKLLHSPRIISVPVLQLTTHLNTMGRGVINSVQDTNLFLSIQQQLKITNANYKSVRRLVQDWHRTTPKEKAHATTRLLQAFRSLAPMADIFKPLEAIAQMQDLELKDVVNPEKFGQKG